MQFTRFIICLFILLLFLYKISATETLEEIGSINKENRDLVVAILDTGMDLAHPNLRSRLFQDSTGNHVSFNTVTYQLDAWDDHGHGTHLAGIIQNHTDARVKILPIKVIDENGKGNVERLINGIRIAIENKARIILTSVGTVFYHKELAETIKEAWNQGTLIIAAAGNYGTEKVVYPAGNLYVLGVSSSLSFLSDQLVDPKEDEFQLSTTSSWGEHIAVAAPGEKVISSFPTYEVYLSRFGLPLEQAELGGTSQAAAFVVGVASQLWLQDMDLANYDIYRKIQQMTWMGKQEGWTEDRGYGLVKLSHHFELDYKERRGGIYGQVVDALGNPVQGSRISLDKGDDEGALTNEHGMFRFTNLNSNTYTLMLNTEYMEEIEVKESSDTLVLLVERK